MSQHEQNCHWSWDGSTCRCLDSRSVPETAAPSQAVRCSCGEVITGAVLDYGRRMGVFRCGGTHCKRADSSLMRALRNLPSEPSRATEARVSILEKLLRERGIEVPS